MKLPGQEGKTTVVVGVITQDMHVQKVLKLKVCTQCVSSPGNSLFKTRGKILTLDELALDSLKDCDIVMLSGSPVSRDVQ